MHANQVAAIGIFDTFQAEEFDPEEPDEDLFRRRSSSAGGEVIKTSSHSCVLVQIRLHTCEERLASRSDAANMRDVAAVRILLVPQGTGGNAFTQFLSTTSNATRLVPTKNALCSLHTSKLQSTRLSQKEFNHPSPPSLQRIPQCLYHKQNAGSVVQAPPQ